jgi:hypothetical protein
MIGLGIVCGLREKIQHRRSRSLVNLIVRGMERWQDHRPAEGVHDAQTAAASQRLPSTVVNGRQSCRGTVEPHNDMRAHRNTSVTCRCRANVRAQQWETTIGPSERSGAGIPL